MKHLAALSLLLLAVAAPARDRLAFIDFYGTKGIDVEAIRAALPFHEGDPYSDALLGPAREVVRRVTGTAATEVSWLCCTQDGDRMIYIGLSGASTKPLILNPAPRQKLRLSTEANALYRAMNEAEDAASAKGDTEEDGMPGYRLSKYPAARAAELRVRDYALRHEAELIRVLNSSSDPEQRSAAADMLGYGKRSRRQIGAFVHAARDPSSSVRNDATRALSEILDADRAAAALVPAEPYIQLLSSGIARDRNKSSMVLSRLTESRDARLLSRLQAEAGDDLLEMARWRNTGWACASRAILARMAGIPENRVPELEFGPIEAFLKAIHHE